MIGWLESWLAPAPDAGRVAFLRSHDFAHRGLHGATGPEENSLRAFADAITAGHGMECDVQLSSDGVPYVFHDDDLDRLADHHGSVAARSSAELDQILLRREAVPIPRLSAVLGLVAGRAPLLIEIKTPKGTSALPLCRAVRSQLESYTGPVAVMSFNPQVSAWFAIHAPHMVRGLVMTEEDTRGIWGDVQRTLATWWARPDFLAYDIRNMPSHFAMRARNRGLPVLTWTVRTAEQQQRAKANADAAIFEVMPGGR